MHVYVLCRYVYGKSLGISVPYFVFILYVYIWVAIRVCVLCTYVWYHSFEYEAIENIYAFMYVWLYLYQWIYSYLLYVCIRISCVMVPWESISAHIEVYLLYYTASIIVLVPTPLVCTVRISMYVYVLSTTYNHHFLLNSVEIESGGFSCDACRYGLVLRSHSMYVCVYVYMHECMFCRIVFTYTM